MTLFHKPAMRYTLYTPVLYGILCGKNESSKINIYSTIASTFFSSCSIKESYAPIFFGMRLFRLFHWWNVDFSALAQIFITSGAGRSNHVMDLAVLQRWHVSYEWKFGIKRILNSLCAVYIVIIRKRNFFMLQNSH